MNINSYFIKFFNKFNFFKNSLIIKISKKLNFKEKKNIIKQFNSTKKTLVSAIILLILSVFYLSIPVLYNKSKLQNKMENQLSNNYNINFIFSTKMKYSLFPWPSYSFENVQISNNNKKFADIKELKVNLEIKNFFSMKSLTIKEVFLEDVKFDIYKKDIDFFFKLLEKDFSKSALNIKDGYIFLKDEEEEVLLINKIKKMKYYYDPKKLKNILSIKNEIFNIAYNAEFINDKLEKKLFSRLDIELFRLRFENEHNYSNKIHYGLSNIFQKKNKGRINYIFENNLLSFDFRDQKKENNINYNGKINFKPFYFESEGNFKKIQIFNLIDINSILVQLLKTETLNNQNLNMSSIIKVKKILPYQKFINLLISIKIKEGLIDIDNTKFSWSNYASFKISDSLIYLNNNQLILDGILDIKLDDYNEIYKVFQTPRNFRKEIENIGFNFSYNFDQEIIEISNIKINNKINKTVGKILNKLISQENIMQNRIYLKNLVNEAIKAYAG